MSIIHHAILIQATASVIILCGFIVATTTLQQRALTRSNEVLATVQPRLRETALYAIALDFLARRRSSSWLFNPVHAIPVWFLVIVVLFGSLISFFGAQTFPLDPTPSYVLGGPLASDPAVDKHTLEAYQSGTVFMGSMAFLGAYVWMIATLVVRINNFDTSPIAFYFLSVRILTALLVATLVRHMIQVLPNAVVGSTNEPGYGLAVLGFLIGWNPTLWLNEVMLRGADLFKQRIARQKMPNADNMPQNMTLSMIQGLLDTEAARLMELNIDNCQKLACENAILIWLRTPYNLDVIVDWIAQAQLFLLFEPSNLDSLRKAGVRDIFAYYIMLSDDAPRTATQPVGGVPAAVMAKHREVLEHDPKFTKLQQLRQAIT